MADRPTAPRIRLTDVAVLARCSAATVSRVLNASDSVNPEVRGRVEAAIRDLGYMRDEAARALRSRRSRTIGLVLPTIRQPIFAIFTEALQEVLAQRGSSLIVMASQFSLDREVSQVHLLAERGVDGIVLIGRTHRPELHALLQARDLPLVSTYTFRSGWPHPIVGFDNAAAMGRVVSHLYELGHRSFAILSGPRRDDDRVADRVDGATAALAARGIALPPERVIEDEFTIGGGRSGLRRLLDTGPRPTAVMCTSDLLAYGALMECFARGIAVPSGLSIVGCDDLGSSQYFHPPLTTLAVPMAEMGRRAGEHLLARIDRRGGAGQEEIEAHLVVRGTTDAPPAPMRTHHAPHIPARAAEPVP